MKKAIARKKRGGKRKVGRPKKKKIKVVEEDTNEPTYSKSQIKKFRKDKLLGDKLGWIQQNTRGRDSRDIQLEGTTPEQMKRIVSANQYFRKVAYDKIKYIDDKRRRGIAKRVERTAKQQSSFTDPSTTIGGDKFFSRAICLK